MTLNEVVLKLKESNKKVQLIYAFNDVGKTRLSREFKNLIAPKQDENEEGLNKIIYYNAFTEDLFYWDNDLQNDIELKLRIQPNSFTDWILKEQGQDKDIIENFQRYSSEKLTPKFNEDFSEVTFSFTGGNEEIKDNIKISKGEESCFIWSIFYSFITQIINELNITENDRSTDKFNELEYIFIDDPVSSLDENHLIEIAVHIAELTKSSKSSIKFIITTHNALFYNVLYNEFKNSEKYILEYQDGEYNLKDKYNNDSPFSYHLYLKSEIEKAIKNNEVKKYHFNFVRNILEKTSTFLGYKNWGEILPKVEGGKTNPYESRIINISSHSKHSTDEIVEINDEAKRILKYIVGYINETYRFNNKNNTEE